MKTIYIIRHAKSSWDDTSLADDKRPLNERGKRDAPFMAKYLAEHETHPDLLVTSYAKRARSTANRFRKVLEMPKETLWTDVRLYLASAEEILDVVRELPANYSIVGLFGHNPGITEFVNRFTEDYIENVPTCGIVKLVSDTPVWYEVRPANTAVKAFYYPKLFNQ